MKKEIKIGIHAQKPFDEVQDGQFVCLWAEETPTPPMLPVNYERMVAKVISKKNKKFLLFPSPRGLSGNWHYNKNLVLKMIESMKVYDEDHRSRRKMIRLLPQNYTITSIQIIDEKLVKEALMEKEKYMKSDIADAQKRLKRFQNDIKKAKFLSGNKTPIGYLSIGFFIFQNKIRRRKFHKELSRRFYL